MYSHFARIHFSQELIRDFRTDDDECSICEKEVKPLGKFLLHVGAKHKMVERYLDMNDMKEYADGKSTTPRVGGIRKKETKLRKLAMKVVGSNEGKGMMMKNRPEARISCRDNRL